MWKLIMKVTWCLWYFDIETMTNSGTGLKWHYTCLIVMIGRFLPHLMVQLHLTVFQILSVSQCALVKWFHPTLHALPVSVHSPHPAEGAPRWARLWLPPSLPARGRNTSLIGDQTGGDVRTVWVRGLFLYRCCSWCFYLLELELVDADAAFGCSLLADWPTLTHRSRALRCWGEADAS